MSPRPAPSDPERFRPHAVRELGGMFDHVSERYDLLNRIMSLGQDRTWRAAMWQCVPEQARVVLDLCTGSGTSLTGLRRPGRLVLGADVSLSMLELAAERHGGTGWAPRLVCADGFHLPLADRSLDVVTTAFGIRNLRPLDDALAELARVLRPGGTLVVLEAAAPSPGPWAPFHGFYLRHVIPLAGRLSADPSAYVYLSRSIFEFGAGPEFERAAVAAGFALQSSRRFMLGATKLWVAQRSPGDGQKVAPPGGNGMQNARPDGQEGVKVPSPVEHRSVEWKVWTGVQAALALAITSALAFGLSELVKSGTDLPLAGWQRALAWLLVVGGLLVFAVRSLILLRRFLGAPPRP